jgi:hypothetical protein
MDAIHRVNRGDQILLGDFIAVDHRPEFGLLRVELGQFTPMMTVDVLVGVAPERLKIRLLRRLLRDPDHRLAFAALMMAAHHWRLFW